MSDASDVVEAAAGEGPPAEVAPEPPLHPPPGVYFGVEEERYHAADGASASKLKLFREAPAKAFFSGPDTPSLRFGTLTHIACLEPHRLEQEYYPTKLERISKREKATQLEQEKAGKRQLVKKAEWDAALRVRDAVHSHPVARDILAPAGLRTEASFWWNDPETEVYCRGRADILREDWQIAADIKTIDSAHHDKVGRSIAEYGYHISAAHYLAGLEEVWRPPRAFWHIFVERDAPHLIAIYEIEPTAMEIGRRLRDEALRGWRECEKAGDWPGYPPEPTQVHMAGWAYAKAGERMP